MTLHPQSASKARRLPWRPFALAALLVGACLAVDFARALAGPEPWSAHGLGRADVPTLLAIGAKVNPWVWAGQVDRLVLAGFLHSSPEHLAVNALWLGVVVFAAAWLAGVPAAFAAAILGSVAGFAASTLVGAGPSVGASAMIVGAAGLIATRLWRLTRGVHAGAAASPRPRPGRAARMLSAVALAGALTATFVPGLGASGAATTDHAAHLGGLAAGLGLGVAFELHLLRPQTAALFAAAVLLAGAALHLVRAPLPAAPSALEPLTADPALWLPAAASPGRFVDGRCSTDARLRATDDLACAVDGFELLALAGAPDALARADASLATLMPPPGRCVRYTTPGEQVLVVRTDADHALVLAGLPSSWARYLGLRQRLSAGRCPGR
ncbi:MAG: rhomboid family intramembrane serine protease [Deltaproteobacteria bacterium]|nr:rhomboid family intramembrane serine protease [Deltaproteobacteria bacterium]